MATAKKLNYMSVEEYLEFEEKSESRHEYVDGRVYAMTGANRRHNIISGNIFSMLHNFLDGSPCRPYVEGLKAHVKAANCFYYPDVMVACDSSDDESVYTEEPVLVVEVLSPSTAAIARREKLTNYMKIPTVKEYMIVHQRKKKIELYRKEHDGKWSMTEFGKGDQIILESIPKDRLSLSVDSIYKNVLDKEGSLEVREEAEQYYLSSEEALALDW